MTNVKSLLEMYVKMGGSLTDTYSDIAGGVPVGQYSTISDAVLACSKKYSAGGGGGAERFVVTLTQENDTWTADKTIAEIVAANAAGKIVVAKYPVGEGMNTEIQLVAVDDAQGVIAALFAGIDVFNENKSVVSVSCLNQGEEDEINVEETPIPTSTNAPLIVTVGDGETAGTLVGNKTYSEVNTAIRSGKTVVLNVDTANYHTSVYVVSCALSDNTYYLRVNIGEDLALLSGSANDYVSITMGG